MALVDYIIILILGLSGFNGFRSGLTRQVAGLLGTLLGLVAAFRYYAAVAAGLEQYFHLRTYLQGALSRSVDTFPGLPELLLRVISLILIFTVVNLAISYAGAMAVGLIRAVHLSLLDRFAGVGLGLLKGLIIISIALRLLNLLPLPGVAEYLSESRYVGTLSGITEQIFREVESMVPERIVPRPLDIVPGSV